MTGMTGRMTERWMVAGAAHAAVIGAAMAQSPLITGEPNNGRSSGQPGAFFDLEVGAAPVVITSWEYYASSSVGTATDVSIFVKEGSFVGFDTDPSAWTLHTSARAVSAGSSSLAPLADPDFLELEADTTYGICFRAETGGIRYRGSGGVPPTRYETDDLALEGGLVRADPFGGTLYEPRIWSGVIHYELDGGGCYADCDEGGDLDFFDFLCFQNEFATGGTYADCDGSGQLDFFDFLCFQDEFAAGCP